MKLVFLVISCDEITLIKFFFISHVDIFSVSFSIPTGTVFKFLNEFNTKSKVTTLGNTGTFLAFSLYF